MRVVIVPDDGYVSVDGVGYSKLVFEIDPSIHAVQWFDTAGWIERREVNFIKSPNDEITDMDQFNDVIDVWTAWNNDHRDQQWPH